MVVRPIPAGREVFWLEHLRIKAGLTREELRDELRDYCEAQDIKKVPGLSTINNWMTRTTHIDDEWQRHLLEVLNKKLPEQDRVTLPPLYVVSPEKDDSDISGPVAITSRRAA